MASGPIIDEPVLVFDMDDTLYPERDFVLSGFAALGSKLERDLGLEGFAHCCTRLFEQGLRGRIFNQALEELGHRENPELIGQLVEAYRGHQPDICLAEENRRFLEKQSAPLALITDGPEHMQRAKIAALGLADHFGLIITTGSWPDGYGKPHPRAYETVMQWSGRQPGQHVYIADNPAKDFIAPRALGWRTVQIDLPGRIHESETATPNHTADIRITRLTELEGVLSL